MSRRPSPTCSRSSSQTRWRARWSPAPSPEGAVDRPGHVYLEGPGLANGLAAGGGLRAPCRDDQLGAADREPRAELVAPAGDLLERILVVARIAHVGLVALVVAHERERDLRERRVLEGEAREHADPVAVGPAAMPGVEREAAQAVEDGLAAVHLDPARVVRPV